MKYAIGIDRPFYPSVEFFEDHQEALEEYNELLKEHLPEGNHEDVHVFIAEVIQIKTINTDY